MAVWAKIQPSELIGKTRIDPEFYQPKYLESERLIKNLRYDYLGNLVKIFKKGIFDIKAEEYKSKGIPFIRITNLKNTLISTNGLTYISEDRNNKEKGTELVFGDLVLSKTAYPACSIIQLDRCNVSQDIIAVKLKKHPIGFNFYLNTFLNSKYGIEQMRRFFQGNVQMHLSLQDAKQILIPLFDENTYLNFQEIYDKSIRNFLLAKKLREQAENKILSELGIRKLDLSPKLTYCCSLKEIQESGRWDTEYYRPKYKKIFEIIHEYENVKSLGDISTFSGGATPKGAEYDSKGVPFFRIQNVQNNCINLGAVVYIHNDIHNGVLKRSKLRQNDVLITITGRIGTSAVVPMDIKEANINQHIVRIRLNYRDVNPYYLSTFLNSLPGKSQTEREAYGTTREALPYHCLEKVLIPVPNCDFQREIEKMIVSANQTRQKAKSLLDEAMTKVEKMIESGGS